MQNTHKIRKYYISNKKAIRRQYLLNNLNYTNIRLLYNFSNLLKIYQSLLVLSSLGVSKAKVLREAKTELNNQNCYNTVPLLGCASLLFLLSVVILCTKNLLTNLVLPNYCP